MKTVLELMSELRKADIRLFAQGQRLLFDAPPGALSEDMRLELGSRKAELLEVLRTEAGKGLLPAEAAEQGIAAAPRGGPVPLSYAQQRLWFLDQLHPGSHAYNIPAHFRLQGPLDRAALQRAFDTIVQRHESLRTRFVIGPDGSPLQDILPSRNVALQCTDCSAATADEWQRFVDEEIEREARKPFDLYADLLLRIHLLRRGPEEHVLLLTMHHIVADGWSLGVFVRELQALYRTEQEQQQPAIPPLRIQYADFAVWQKQWLSGDVLDRQLEYWRRRLASPAPLLSLPADHVRPAVQRYDGASVAAVLPRALTRAIREVSERQNTTLFSVLLAAYNVLLNRYSGQNELSVGFPIANRNRSEIEPLIGFFVNTLILRTTIGSETTFRGLIADVSQSVVSAHDHQDVPYERLVEMLQPERSTSYNALFQAMFSLNPPTPTLHLSGLQPAQLGFCYASSKFDLSLFIEDSGGELKAVVAYSTALFGEQRMQTLLAHFQSVLEWLITYPDRAVSELDIAVERTVRADLPAPCPPSPSPGYEAPQNKTEETIADVWKQLLGLDRISVLDNFFDLGGHSLLIVQARAMLARLLNRNIAVVELFQFPTVRSLAQRLSGTDNASESIRAAYSRAHQQRLAMSRTQRAGRSS